MKPTIHIPLARPEVTEADRDAVLAVLRSTDLSCGPKVLEFEHCVARYSGVAHAVAVSSGTSALHLGLRCLNLPPGSEVIVPSFTFGAVLNVLLQENLCPVFAEIDVATMNVTPEAVEAAITPRTSAIIAVHTFGRPLEMARLCAIAHSRGISLLEDACEALGSETDGGKAGSFGEVSMFAFYPNKQITTGEGGMLLTASASIAERACRLRNQGRDPALNWLQHVETGYSYRLADINCALGLSQMSRLEAIVARREAIASTYNSLLVGVAGVVRPCTVVAGGRISWFCYVIQLAAEFSAQDRDSVHQTMLSRGIATGRYFSPMHRQPVLAMRSRSANFSNAQAEEVGGDPHLPVTDFVSDRVLALPFFHQISQAEQEEVARVLAESVEEARSARLPIH